MVVHAGGQAGRAVRRHGVGGHGNDGQPGPAQVASDASGGGEAVHHRHLQVHQHGVHRHGAVFFGLDRRHGLSAIARHHHIGTFAGQQLARHLLVVGVVFDQQDAQALQALRCWRRIRDAWALGSQRLQPAQGLHQHGRRERLGQADLAVAAFVQPMRGQHQQTWRQPGAGILAQVFAQLCRLVARQRVGHHHRRQGQRLGAAAARCGHLVQHRQRLRDVDHRLRAPAQALHHAHEHLTGLSIRMHQQKAARTPIGGHLGQGLRAVRHRVVAAHVQQVKGRYGHVQREVKPTALAQRAFHGQFTTHHRHQPVTDAQAQACATEAPGGRGLGLRKAAEDLLLVLGRDADAGVTHRPDHGHRPRVMSDHPRRQHHFALLGELQRIAHQVHQHLLQPQRVAHQDAGQAGVDVEQQRQRLVQRVGRDDDREIAQQAFGGKGLGLEHHLAGLDLGEIEDVVEQRQQRTRGASGLLGVVGLTHRQRGFFEQGEHAQHGVHGRADFMAHVGQKPALGQRRLLGGLAGLHQLGDVDAKAHDMAVGQLAFNDAQRAAVVQALDQGAVGLLVHGHTFGHPFVDTACRVGVFASLGTIANQLFKVHTRHHQVGDLGIELAVFVVAEHQPVIAVEQHKGLVDGVDGAAQQSTAAAGLGLGLLELADVELGADQPMRAAVAIGCKQLAA